MLKKNNIEDVATFFLSIVDREAGSTITPLKLQKLLYYAQGWYLGYYNKPLFNEDFEAWAHGPANRMIYSKYKEYGYDTIPEPDYKKNNFDEKTIRFLASIWNTYGIYDGKYLEHLTHQETPWKKAIEENGGKYNKIITKDSMKEFFKTKIRENNVSNI